MNAAERQHAANEALGVKRRRRRGTDRSRQDGDTADPDASQTRCHRLRTSRQFQGDIRSVCANACIQLVFEIVDMRIQRLCGAEGKRPIATVAVEVDRDDGAGALRRCYRAREQPQYSRAEHEYRATRDGAGRFQDRGCGRAAQLASAATDVETFSGTRYQAVPGASVIVSASPPPSGESAEVR